MSEPQRAILDWGEPTAPAAARWLQDRWPLGLSDILVIVPTQHAGRRLRATLAGPMPVIVTPPQFLQPAGEDLADALEAALAIAEELGSPRSVGYPALFPGGMPTWNFSDCLTLARSVRALQSELAEGGLTLKEAVNCFPPDFPESARWEDLSALVMTAERSLARSGLRDRDTVRLKMLREPKLPPGIREVVVLAVADLQPAIALALQRLREPVTILVPGPADAAMFDPWGRPRTGNWIERDPGWTNFEDQIQLVARPDSLSVELVAGPDLEIGLLDRELLPGLTEILAAQGFAIHDPTGTPLLAHWLIRTLCAFSALVQEPTFSRAVDLLRNGAVRAWLAEREPGFEPDAALEAADEIRIGHFPDSLRAARPWLGKSAALRIALDRIENILDALSGKPIKTMGLLAHSLAKAFTPFLDTNECEMLSSALEAVDAALERLQRAVPAHPRFSPADWLHAFREALAATHLYPPSPQDAVEAGGWLELPWSEAPRLLLAGMNLGKVPAPLGTELFLNESTRSMLGLPGVEDRRARDAYFLARLLAMRGPGSGRLDILVGQLDAEGSPLQPSPLLFAGAGTALPSRVELMFEDPRPPRPDPAWTAGWLLDPPVIEVERKISVTDFERYLDCPFTFYLSRVVAMQSIDPAVDELDAAQFGDLIHFALENWAADETASGSTDPAIISRALDAQVTAWANENLGARLSLPLRVQVDSARSRLAAFANWQAQDRRDGWRIRQVETNFQTILGRPWEFAGWTISGRVDRLDENERDGRWRVVDYKTFDSSDSPEKKHLRAFRASGRSWPPDYAHLPESSSWWINLQLPLYRQLLIESGRAPEVVECGYFNLPKTISETRLQTWEGLQAIQESALACTRGVLADLARRRFWPPNPRASHPDFADFFPPDPLRVVDPNGAFVKACAS